MGGLRVQWGKLPRFVDTKPDFGIKSLLLDCRAGAAAVIVLEIPEDDRSGGDAIADAELRGGLSRDRAPETKLEKFAGV
jgi:hypothetical protein